MALSSYAELKSAVADYMGRDGDVGFVSQIPTFIALCEARLNRVLRDGRNEIVAQLTPNSSGEAILPTNFRQVRSVNVGDAAASLEYLTPDEAELRYGDETGTPASYTIIGRTMFIYPISEDPVFLLYYSGVTGLSDTETSNWLLESHPDVYLFGSLVEACLFAGLEDQRSATWEQRFAGAIDDMRQEDQGARWGRARAQVPYGVIP